VSIDLGETVQRTVVFRNSAGVATACDSTPTYAITLPDGTAGTSPAVVSGSVGEYFVLYPTVTAGMHRDLWTGLVAGVTVRFGPDSFRVRESGPAPLLSLAEGRALLGLGVDVLRDERLRDYIDSATAIIERRTDLVWRRQTVTETHAAPWQVLWIRKAPLVAVTAVTDNGASVDLATLTIDTLAGTVARRYGGNWIGPVVVTYTAGPTDPSADALAAARMVLLHLWTTQAVGSSGSPRRSTGADSLPGEVERALRHLARPVGGP
jgi:hypothetical protein